MHSLTPPAQLSAEQRRIELAGILAAGFLRMRGRKGYVPPELRDDPSTREQSASRTTGAGDHDAPNPTPLGGRHAGREGAAPAGCPCGAAATHSAGAAHRRSRSHPGIG